MLPMCSATAGQRSFSEIWLNQKVLMKQRVSGRNEEVDLVFKSVGWLCRTVMIKGQRRSTGLNRITCKDAWCQLSSSMSPEWRLSSRAVVSVLWSIVWFMSLAARKGWNRTETASSPTLKNSTPIWNVCPSSPYVWSKDLPLTSLSFSLDHNRYKFKIVSN